MVNKIPNYLYSGSLGVGRDVANDANVYLQVGPNGAGTKGVLLPRVADTSAISGTKRNGLLIYSNQLGAFAYFDSTSVVWRKLGFTDTTVISTKANTQKVVDDTAAVLRTLVGSATTLDAVVATGDWTDAPIKLFRSGVGNVSTGSVSMSATGADATQSKFTLKNSDGGKLFEVSNLYTNSAVKELRFGTDSYNINMYVETESAGSSTLAAKGVVDFNIGQDASGIPTRLKATNNYLQGTNTYLNATNTYVQPFVHTGARFVKHDALGKLYASDTLSASGAPISGLTAATATNTINNADYAQEWQWNTLSGSALKLSSTSTAGANNNKVLDVTRSGANGTSSVESYGVYSSISNTGTNSSNYAVRGTATGGTLDNIGVFGSITGTTEGIGVYGLSSATGFTTHALRGINSGAGTVGYGGRFETSGSTNTAYGVHGSATSTASSTNYGGYFTASGATTNYGIRGIGTQYGVYGESANSIGVYGITQSSDFGTGIGAVNNGTSAGTGYGLTADASGTKTTNIAGKFSASGGTNNHALVTTNGNVGFGTAGPDSKAIVEISSTTQGFLLPRMTKTQRDAITSPPAGLMVYQTDNTPGLRVYNGTNWMRYTETAD
jgi:hypothetical protein